MDASALAVDCDSKVVYCCAGGEKNADSALAEEHGQCVTEHLWCVSVCAHTPLPACFPGCPDGAVFEVRTKNAPSLPTWDPVLRGPDPSVVEQLQGVLHGEGRPFVKSGDFQALCFVRNVFEKAKSFPITFSLSDLSGTADYFLLSGIFLESCWSGDSALSS